MLFQLLNNPKDPITKQAFLFRFVLLLWVLLQHRLQDKPQSVLFLKKFSMTEITKGFTNDTNRGPV